MTLQSRMNKVNKVSQSATLIHQASKLRRSYRVDSVRDSKPYQVQLEWSKEDGIPTVTGKLFSFETKYFQFNHPANSCQTVCYQVLGSIKAAAKSEGKIISFCDSFNKAVKLLNFGGQLVKIRNMDNGIVWGVVR